MKITLFTICVCALFVVGCKGSDTAPVEVRVTPTPSSSTAGPDLGVPIYPGSALFEVSGVTSKVPGASAATSSNRSTPDSTDKVLAFYKEKLPGFEVTKSEELVTLTGKGSDGHTVAISITKDGTGSKIVIVNMSPN